MRKPAAILLCLGLSAGATAQTVSKPDGAWRGALGANVSAASGNNESVSAGLNTDAVRQSETFTFDVFAGYSHNREELYSGAKRAFDEGMIGEETTHKISDSTSLRQRLTLFPNLTESGEYRVVFDASLLMPLVERWNLTVNLSARYQSNPPLGVQKSDTLLFTGLQYSWGPQ
jgi:putative salt-induced outer membrane protein YdiY